VFRRNRRPRVSYYGKQYSAWFVREFRCTDWRRVDLSVKLSRKLCPAWSAFICSAVRLTDQSYYWITYIRLKPDTSVLIKLRIAGTNGVLSIYCHLHAHAAAATLSSNWSYCVFATFGCSRAS